MGTFLGILSLQIRRKKQSTNSSDRIPIYVFALFFVWSISLFWIGYSESTAIQLNVSFNQKVAIISPFITDRDEKILKAEWASMRNYSDYKKINERLNKIANTNHIVFP